MTVPTVTYTLDKPAYNKGDQVKVQLQVTDGVVDSVKTRTATGLGHDGEGNPVDINISVTVHTPVPDTFVLDSMSWDDTHAAFAINGLLATGVA